MSSSNKTLNLGLNKWLGSDKPKKDDFNADNQLLDDAWKTLNTSVTGAATSLGSHTANTTSHITAAERTEWNSKAKFTMGTYKGDGALSRKITLGFKARFGYLFAAAASVAKVDFDSYNCNIYAGCFGSSGCSEGIAADSTGFTVTHHSSNRPNGHTLKFNDASYTYVYIAWQ